MDLNSQIASLSALNRTIVNLSQIELPYKRSDFAVEKNQIIVDDRGELNVFQLSEFKSFNIKRIFTHQNIPHGIIRGGHAHEKCVQYLTALSGKCTLNILTRDGIISLILDTPHYGVLIKPGTWIYQEDFSENCVVLVLASENYESTDYIFELPVVAQSVIDIS